MVKPVILQFVGYHNSGKTTVMTKIIGKLTGAGIKAVTIKHHGHGGKPDPLAQKDSTRLLDAGAYASIVEGEGGLSLQAVKSSWTLTEQIDLIRFFKPDVILIEGHKKAQFPKIVLLKDKGDIQLITQLENIKAVIVWDEQLIGDASLLTTVPIFLLQEEKYLSWIYNFLIL